MNAFFVLISDFYKDIIGLFNSTQLDGGAYQITLGSILFCCLVIGLVVSVFWKGAKA